MMIVLINDEVLEIDNKKNWLLVVMNEKTSSIKKGNILKINDEKIEVIEKKVGKSRFAIDFKKVNHA